MMAISRSSIPQQISKPPSSRGSKIKGARHYKRNGTLYTGSSHKMANGDTHTGKGHTKTSKKLFKLKDLSVASKRRARA